jgi:SNF2 family DNA or RNA helicase
LLSFIGVSSLAVKSTFDFWVASPFGENGPQSLKRLKDLISATSLRRTKKMLNDVLELPPRLESTETIDLGAATAIYILSSRP